MGQTAGCGDWICFGSVSLLAGIGLLVVLSVLLWIVARRLLGFVGSSGQRKKNPAEAIWYLGMPIGGPLLPIIGWALARSAHPRSSFSLDHAKLAFVIQLNLMLGYLGVVGPAILGLVDPIWMVAYVGIGTVLQIPFAVRAWLGRPVFRFLVAEGG